MSPPGRDQPSRRPGLLPRAAESWRRPSPDQGVPRWGTGGEEQPGCPVGLLPVRRHRRQMAGVAGYTDQQLQGLVHRRGLFGSRLPKLLQTEPVGQSASLAQAPMP